MSFEQDEYSVSKKVQWILVHLTSKLINYEVLCISNYEEHWIGNLKNNCNYQGFLMVLQHAGVQSRNL